MSSLPKLLRKPEIFRTLNPINNKLIKEYIPINEYEINKLTSIAHNGYLVNKARTFRERGTIVSKLGELLKRDANKLATSMAVEIGKPIQYGLQEVNKAAGQCDYYAKNAENLLKDTVIQTNYKKSYVKYQPTGTIFYVMPWNFPVWLPMKAMIPSLMLGNATILKPSPTCPQTSLALESLFKEAGFVKNEFSVALVPVDLMYNVVSNSAITGVSLTGSTRAGRDFASLAGQYGKKNIMELGGSDPFIVCQDADLELAAKMGALGRLLNTGQVCISSKRFLIHSSVYEEYKIRLKAYVDTLKIGDPLSMETNIGPMARKDLADAVKAQCLKSIDFGAKPLFGDLTQLNINDYKNGNFVTPLAFEDIPPHSPLALEEVFGPVFSLWKFNSDKEAIEMANSSMYGLGSAVFTKSEERALKYCNEVDTGSIFVNDICKTDSRLPAGGTKGSGYGRECAEQGIKEFANHKTVVFA